MRACLQSCAKELDWQTATSDVLGVIAGSPGRIEPVFNTILDNALRLCEADTGNLMLLEADGSLRYGTMRGARPEYEDYVRQAGSFIRHPEGNLELAIRRKAPLQIADVRESRAYVQRVPQAVAAIEMDGQRTVLFVPLLREKEAIGIIIIYRRQVRPFDQKHVALVENFAKQAVIAIENARLLTELRELLDRQTATADILRVIASTPGDPTRALDRIAETAARMFDAWGVGIRRLEGGVLRQIAAAGSETVVMRERLRELPLYPANHSTQAVLEMRQIHIEGSR